MERWDNRSSRMRQALTILTFLLCEWPLEAREASKPRLVVLTDIGGDPDDSQSLVRLMTYANEFQIEGLIASAAGIPKQLKANVVRPDLIREVMHAYGLVRQNLTRHAEGYPATSGLMAVIRSGNPVRGLSSIGEEKDTEGSNWIISVVDRPDKRPVNVSVWGGSTDLAQALWRVRKDRPAGALESFVSKIRVHAIGHQDETGPWILDNFPSLFYVLSSADRNDVSGRPQQGIDRRQSTYRGMYLGGDESLTSRDWIDSHVRLEHGPLGALYPTKTWTAPNPHGVLKEGDTPAWFYFLPLGLSDPEHPEWGGWGGRFQKIRPFLYNDAPDTVDGVTDPRAAVWRWRPDFQADWQARMDWCVATKREQANHAPLAVLNGDQSRSAVFATAQPGSIVRLSAAGSRDPDGQALSYDWFQYPEAGSLEESVSLRGASKDAVEFAAPTVTEPRTVHIILRVQDNGSPNLAAFRRAVITIKPAQGQKGPR